MAFVIETGIEKIASARGRKPTEFPFDQMEVNASFLIAVKEDTQEAETKKVESWRRKLRVSLKAYQATEEGFKIETAQVEGGLRVWRTQ